MNSVELKLGLVLSISDDAEPKESSIFVVRNIFASDDKTIVMQLKNAATNASKTILVTDILAAGYK